MSVTDTAFIKVYRAQRVGRLTPETLDPPATDSKDNTVVTGLAGATSERIASMESARCSTIFAGAGQGGLVPTETTLVAEGVPLPRPEQMPNSPVIRADIPHNPALKGPYAWRLCPASAIPEAVKPPVPDDRSPSPHMSQPSAAYHAPARQPVARHPVARPFEAAWEVDRFVFPETCQRLQQQCATQLTDVIRGLLQSAWQGQNILAVTSFNQHEGVTTLAIALAELASSFQMGVALVDGNLHHPDLGASLGLAYQQGWEHFGPDVPLEEVAIQSATNPLVVVPRGRNTGHRGAEQAADLIQGLKAQFELVVLDAGPMFAAAHDWFTPPAVDGIHGAIVVRDTRTTQEQQLRDVLCRLETAGVSHVGIIENFLH